MTKYNRPNGKLFGSSASNIGVFGSGQTGETATTSTDPNVINTLGTHWEQGWNGAVVSQAPYTAPFIEDMNAINYVNSYNSAYLLQKGIPAYASTETYQVDSVCTYNGEIWISLVDNNTGNTPAEGTYWHLQSEVPSLPTSNVLIGSTNNTPVALDTSLNGDIEASSTGLNIKAGIIENADINANASIDESKVNLAYSTTSLNTTITNHTTNTSNPHSVTKAQILTGDLIVNNDIDAGASIDESKLNLAHTTTALQNDIDDHITDDQNPHSVTKAQVLTGDLIVNSDIDAGAMIDESKVDLYKSTSTLWTEITTHEDNKNNPHDTSLVNLTDTTISSPSDGQTLLYDADDQKWKNQTLTGGALSTLTDVTLTSTADKNLLQYDSNTSKWINSSSVWTNIEINDIAYVGATPQGHTIDSNNNVTMVYTDNRTQILTATDGYGIILPSANVKAGEKFTFKFSNTFGASITTPFVFKLDSSTALKYCYTSDFDYIFAALVDNPSSSSDWLFSFLLNTTEDRHNIGRAANLSKGSNATSYSGSTGSLISRVRGIYIMSGDFNINDTRMSQLCMYFYIVEGGTDEAISDVYDNQRLGIAAQGTGCSIGLSDPYSSFHGANSTMFAPAAKTILAKLKRINNTIAGRCDNTYSASINPYMTFDINATLIAPITDSVI